MANDKELIKKVDEAIKSLSLPAQFDFEYLVKKIKDQIGQEIEFIPCNMPNNITGLAVTGEQTHILYEANVSPLHQAQIKLHELGHIILDHMQVVSATEDEYVLNSFFTSVNSYTKQLHTIVIARRKYDAEHETEAELFATKLVGRLNFETYFRDDPILTICIE